MYGPITLKLLQEKIDITQMDIFRMWEWKRDSGWHWSHGERAIRDILSYNQDSAIYSVQDLLLNKLENYVSSARFHVYIEKKIEDFGSSLVELIKGIMKIREVSFQFEEQKITALVKDESMGNSRKVMLLVCQRVAKLKSFQDILTDKSSHDGEDKTEETEESYCILFYFLTSKEYFMGLVKSFISDVLYKKEEKQ